ncbi:TNT domain-containing protein [Micromonospora sp. NPDC001898]|uniref:TNT domain-containing protein n=1 Tax=Micromonospora sp. NPDC001898 TaxID=3364221 RepID=UPI00367B0D73
MSSRRWLVAALSGAALVLLPGAAYQFATPAAMAQADALTEDGRSQPGQPGGRPAPYPGGGPSQPSPPTPQGLCRPGLPPNAPETTQFFDGNRLLGPSQLPAAAPVGPLLAGYQRLGAQSESQWLANYTAGSPAQLRFPPQDGYVLGPHGEPIKARQTLLSGYRLDRFGFPGGGFLSPLGTPFSARSLAPQSLNTPPIPPPPPGVPAAAPLANYHTYCVLKPFDVDSGPIAPWFAQPGLGTQFQLNPAYVPQAGGTLNVQWLIDHQYIVEEYLGAAGPSCPTTAVPQQGRADGAVPVC